MSILSFIFAFDGCNLSYASFVPAPAKSVISHLSTILKAVASLITAAPSVNTLASLCSRERSASPGIDLRREFRQPC